MFSISNAAQAKKSATALRKVLMPLGLELTRSTAYEVLSKIAGFTDWNAMSAALTAARAPAATLAKNAEAAPSIFDVPFGSATSISIDGDHYDIHSIVDEVMAWLPKWNNPANPCGDDDSQTALFLQYEEDGLLYDKELQVSTLLTAKWDAQKDAFVSGEGEVIRVFFRIQFGKTLEVPAKAAIPEVPAGYRVYETMMGTWRWSVGDIYGPGPTPRLDGTNLPTRAEAVAEAVEHAKASATSAVPAGYNIGRRVSKPGEPEIFGWSRETGESGVTIESQNFYSESTAVEDATMHAAMCKNPIHLRAEEIKAEYLSGDCRSEDVDYAIERLEAECGQRFSAPYSAWEFLMEEPHEDNEDN